MKFFLIRKREKQVDTTLAQNHMGLSIIAQSPEHKIAKLLKTCNVDGADPLPRQWMELSRLLYNDVPIYENAIDIHVRLVGKPIIPDDAEISDQTRMVVNEYLKNIPILHELQPDHGSIFGIQPLMKQLITQVLRDGMAFSEDRFRVAEEVVTDEHIGLLLFNSKNFKYRYHNTGKWVLEYLSNQYPEYDQDGNYLDNPFFHTLKLENDERDLWGVPLIRGGRLISNVFTSLLVVLELQALRFGNPVSFNLIGQKDTSVFHDPNNRGLFIQAIESLKHNVAEAHKKSTVGQRSDLISALPGDVTLVSKTYGSDFNNWIDDETLWKITLLFSTVTSVPPSLLGVREGGGGIGSEEFAFQFKMLMARINSIRAMMLPYLVQVCRNYLTSIGYNPIEIERVAEAMTFSEMDMLTEREKAEIEKLKAEAEKIRYETLDGIRVMDSGSAQEYMDKHGLV